MRTTLNCVGDSFGNYDENQALCRLEPAAWDVDSATPGELRRSARTCVLACPLYLACRNAVASGSANPRSMVWAGQAYDHNGDTLDLDQPGHKVGSRNERDTRIPDSAGRIYNGHTGRWQPPSHRHDRPITGRHR
jgi:hypothetical protein